MGCLVGFHNWQWVTVDYRDLRCPIKSDMLVYIEQPRQLGKGWIPRIFMRNQQDTVQHGLRICNVHRWKLLGKWKHAFLEPVPSLFMYGVGLVGPETIHSISGDRWRGILWSLFLRVSLISS